MELTCAELVNKSSSSLDVKWSAPPSDKIHGHIRHYLIKYWKKLCSDSNVTVNATIEEKTVGPRNYSLLLDGLKYWKCYQVNVDNVDYSCDCWRRTLWSRSRNQNFRKW